VNRTLRQGATHRWWCFVKNLERAPSVPATDEVSVEKPQ
jgi:hypothetical protein